MHSARIGRDFWAGALMALIGLGALLKARTYGLGALADIGPGFLPTVLGAVLVLVGILIGAGVSPGKFGAEADTGHIAAGAFDWRGGGAIVLSVIAFISLAAYAGLVPAVFGCVYIAALGDRTARLASRTGLALGVTLLSTLVFHYLLRLPLQPFRW